MASDTGDVPSGTDGDISGDITWMSYAELGRARGISTASAKRLAIRRHWRRQLGNDQQARVAVPVTEAVTPAMGRGDNTSDLTGDIARVVSGFEAALTVLREQLQAAERRADTAEVGRVGDRLRADELRAQVDALQAQLAANHGALERLQGLETAEAARKARGILARLRAAWRGG